MSRSYKILTGLLSASCLLVLVGGGYAHGQTTIKPKFGSGALDEAATRTEKLLQLKWNGDNIALKRDWDSEEEKAGEDPAGEQDDKFKAEIKKLVDRGVPEEQAAEIAEKLLQSRLRIGDMMKKSPAGNAVERAFYAIPSSFRGSSGSTGLAERRRLYFSKELLSGTALLGGDDLRFQLIEKNGQRRSFEFSDNGKGRVKFEFVFADLLVRLLQTETGKTQLIWIDDKSAKVFVGDSFSDFMKRNPQVVDTMLFPLFKHLGVKEPTSPPAP